MASVHDVTDDAAQVGPGHGVAKLHVAPEHPRAHCKVAGGERVAAGEAKGAETPPAQDRRVEEGEGEEHRLEQLGLGCLLEERFAERRERHAHVGLDVGGRLVGDLYRGLQDRLGHGARAGVERRLGREEAAEIGVARLRAHLEQLLELGQPARYELDVLQHHPSALYEHPVERLLGDGLLPLAERDRHELARLLRLAELRAEHAHGHDGVDAGREQEEDGHGGRRVLERHLEVERDRVYVLVANRLAHPQRDREHHAVGPHGAHDLQPLEAAEPLPLLRQRHLLGLLRLDPLLPPLPRALHVLRQVGEGLLRRERHDGEPRGV
mmetsp:Transcript_25449/g.58881  ORF Transcript_25449/g.58881 Transcript_25449/m.58881 type:complete len:324 (+) Transcript_25449:1353-2324(+)